MCFPSAHDTIPTSDEHTCFATRVVSNRKSLHVQTQAMKRTIKLGARTCELQEKKKEFEIILSRLSRAFIQHYDWLREGTKRSPRCLSQTLTVKFRSFEHCTAAHAACRASLTSAFSFLTTRHSSSYEHFHIVHLVLTAPIARRPPPNSTRQS